MSHYLDPPDDPDASPIVVATPEEVHALTPAIRAYYRRRRVFPREIDDLAQNVEVITWSALKDGRVRGPRWRDPDQSLHAYMLEVAWKLLRNHRTLGRVRLEWPEPEPENHVDALVALRDPSRMIEAREILARLMAHPKILVFLVNSIDVPPRIPGKSRVTAYLYAARMRRWLRKVCESGVWREPPQPRRRRPRDRKRGR